MIRALLLSMALTAAELYQSPDILSAAKKEFEEKRGDDFVYEPLVGDRAPHALLGLRYLPQAEKEGDHHHCGGDRSGHHRRDCLALGFGEVWLSFRTPTSCRNRSRSPAADLVSKFLLMRLIRLPCMKSSTLATS